MNIASGEFSVLESIGSAKLCLKIDHAIELNVKISISTTSGTAEGELVYPA